jgi:hypothetical protein
MPGLLDCGQCHQAIGEGGCKIDNCVAPEVEVAATRASTVHASADPLALLPHAHTPTDIIHNLASIDKRDSQHSFAIIVTTSRRTGMEIQCALQGPATTQDSFRLVYLLL